MNFYILDSAEDTASYGVIDKKLENFISISYDPIQKKWPEIILEEKFGDLKLVGRKADFHTTSFLAPIVSQNFVDKIGSDLTDYGTLLPLNIKGRNQTFYRFDCNNIIDCLDYKKSNLREIKVSLFKTKIGIKKPVFLKNKIGSSLIFRVPNTAVPTIFVTEKFKELVLKNELTGVKFLKDEYDFDGFET